MNVIIVEQKIVTNQTFQIVQGDLTLEEVDAIVNAANERLEHGGGVAWAISQKGGATVQQESDEWIRKNGLISHARPAWTLGGSLPAKYIIHAVGPIWQNVGDEDKKLSDAVIGSLRVADELQCKSISMPAISTGIFGFPKERAAKIIFSAVDEYFAKTQKSNLQQVRIILFDPPTLQAFVNVWQAYQLSKNKKHTLLDWIDGIIELFS
ncbi:MAG: macro domain-containing protein [Anaerolineales bacterium]|nr:macro domain-containing protein [Anaerolineales bacterium]